MSFKDKVEGNELDLSLNELTEVPVKELANTPKATHLDLSCNRIQSLPNEFTSLTHLVKIDLSRNKLTELPQNFGNLLNLQYLDLDKNELKNLPISFSRLKNLRWLDLKDNPLDPKLKGIVGDCLDEKQCQECAKKVVLYMKELESNKEREKQKKLKEKREKEALEKAIEKEKEEKELEERRRQKKMEKERRKALHQAHEEKLKQTLSEKDSPFSETKIKDNVTIGEKKGVHWCMVFLPLICIILSIVIYFLITSKDFSIQNINLSDVKISVQKHILRCINSSLKFWHTYVLPLIFSVKRCLMKNIHSIMICISNAASELELYLSVYLQ